MQNYTFFPSPFDTVNHNLSRVSHITVLRLNICLCIMYILYFLKVYIYIYHFSVAIDFNSKTKVYLYYTKHKKGNYNKKCLICGDGLICYSFFLSSVIYMYISALFTFLKSKSQLFQHIQSFLLVLKLRHPKIVAVFADICQNGAADEHHVLSAGRVFDADFKFLCVGIV